MGIIMLDFDKYSKTLNIIDAYDAYEDINQHVYDSINYNNFNRFKKLVECGLDINIKLDTRFKDTPLLIAIRKYEYNIVNYILNLDGVDVNIKNANSDTPLKWVYGRSYDIVIKLLQFPNIEIIQDGECFLNKKEDNSYLINYELQKKILDNDREDIILQFEEFGLVYKDIKEEYPNLFNAIKWGLV
jgi:ankyrin repeat protein